MSDMEVGLLFAILPLAILQLGGLIWALAVFHTKIGHIASDMAIMGHHVGVLNGECGDLAEKSARIEERLKSLEQSIQRIERNMERLEEE